MRFRSAVPEDAEILTQLTLESKGHWGYPKEYIAMWTEELTVCPTYIEENMVVLVEEKNEILGYISVIEKDATQMLEVGAYKISGGFYLDNLFIRPSYIRKGIGEKLVIIASDWCRERQIKQLYVVSDPNSKGFYEKVGAVCLGALPSSIAGRHLPCLVFNF